MPKDTNRDGPTLETYIETRLNLHTESLKEQAAVFKDALAEQRAYFERVLDERRRSHEEKFASVERATKAALEAQEKATSAAFAASEKAINISQTHADSWRKDANEWRGAMDDREIKFASRIEMDSELKGVRAETQGVREKTESELKGVRAEIQLLRESRVAAGARGQGSVAMWGYVVGGFSFLLLLLTLLGVLTSLASNGTP